MQEQIIAERDQLQEELDTTFDTLNFNMTERDELKRENVGLIEKLKSIEINKSQLQ